MCAILLKIVSVVQRAAINKNIMCIITQECRQLILVWYERCFVLCCIWLQVFMFGNCIGGFGCWDSWDWYKEGRVDKHSSASKALSSLTWHMNWLTLTSVCMCSYVSEVSKLLWDNSYDLSVCQSYADFSLFQDSKIQSHSCDSSTKNA